MQQFLVIEYLEEAPIANFTTNTTNGYNPLTVQFTDTSTGGKTTTYAWDFNNDGIVDSTAQNPTYTYSAAGTYTVKLTVTNSVGSSTEIKNDFIVVYQPAVAYFTANTTNGELPLNVKFTDLSTGTVTSWAWDFDGDGITDSTEQNPTHTYVYSGIYTVKLTVSNPGGMSNSKTITDYITVKPAPQPDLIIMSIDPNVGAGGYLFANEPNVISVTVKNNGTAASDATTVNVIINGTSYTVDVPALDVGADTTVTVTDPVSRTCDDNVPVSANADPSNTIPETNETNNNYTTTLTVYNNGYKGKRYTDGEDLETQQTFEGYYDLIYSTGDSSYRGSGSAKWDTPYTATWTSSDLVIPDGATVVSARLYQAYTWNAMLGIPDFIASFNGNTLTALTHYSDTKGFGSSNYPSGVIVYDVTNYFNTLGNTLTLTKGTTTTTALYGSYLIVVYQDSNTTLKTIYINDGADLLCSRTDYSINDTEATTYANFNNVNITDMGSAKAIAILASASDTDKSKFFFNNQEYTGFWNDYISSPNIGFSQYDVSNAIQSGLNAATLQSYNTGTNGDNILVLGTILITAYGPADLVASNLTVPSEPIAGTTYTVTADIANSGASAATFTVRLYDNGVSVGKQVITLAAGESTQLTFNWTPTTTDSHELMVWADPTNSIAESNEANNQQMQTVIAADLRPDLVVTNLTVPTSPLMGTSYDVTVDVANNGTSAATFTVRLYEDSLTVGKQIITLAPGESTHLTFTWKPAATGSYELMVWADPTNSIAESNEANNQQLQTVTVAGQPDLVVTNLTVPTSPLMGTSYDVTVDVANNGTSAATFTVRLYEDGLTVGKQIITLAPGESTQLTFTWKSTSEGSHELKILADPTNSIAESNEANNQQLQTVTAADLRSDLVTTNLTVPDSPVVGNSYDVTVDVTNTIGSTATFTVRLYDNGVSVGKQIITLAAGESTQLTFNWTPTTTDSHELMVWADPANSIIETDETNNQQVATVSVT